nr:MAG TPA: hypothetical protein [Caudoviricetes sp.]
MKPMLLNATVMANSTYSFVVKELIAFNVLTSSKILMQVMITS